MTKQECKTRPKVININSDDPLFYPYNILINKFSGSCNNINDPHAKLCVPDVVKGINIKVFNPMSRNNEIRYMKWHETCRCKCRLDAGVCINKQRWNVNVKNSLTKVDAVKDLFLVIVNVSVINRVMLENIWTMKIVNAE